MRFSQAASEAGNGTPFLVIQATGRKSILHLTGIYMPEKGAGSIGTDSQPRFVVHQSADFPHFALKTVEVVPNLPGRGVEAWRRLKSV